MHSRTDGLIDVTARRRPSLTDPSPRTAATSTRTLNLSPLQGAKRPQCFMHKCFFELIVKEIGKKKKAAEDSDDVADDENNPEGVNAHE